MGFFSKIKNMFKGADIENEVSSNDVNTGLEKKEKEEMQRVVM